MNDKRLYSGERLVKTNLKALTAYQLYRYISAYKYISSTDIVGDLGCGVGAGSYLLAKKAKKVIGIDNSPEAIQYARKYWSENNIEYRCQDILEVSNIFDVIVCNEVIEHISNPDKLFQLFSKIVKSYLIFSIPTPVQKQTNKFHIKHYLPSEIKKFLTNNSFKLIRFDGMKLPFYVAKRII